MRKNVENSHGSATLQLTNVPFVFEKDKKKKKTFSLDK